MRRIGSVCTGAFLLGHAGLLDGRRATTHWNSTGRLVEQFPKVLVEPNTIYVKDGPIYTTAGVTASMDLALALVEEDHGRSVALRVAKELILFLKRPGGQSQFSVHLETQIAEIGPIRDIHEWILLNLVRRPVGRGARRPAGHECPEFLAVVQAADRYDAWRLCGGGSRRCGAAHP